MNDVPLNKMLSGLTNAGASHGEAMAFFNDRTPVSSVGSNPSKAQDNARRRKDARKNQVHSASGGKHSKEPVAPAPPSKKGGSVPPGSTSGGGGRPNTSGQPPKAPRATIPTDGDDITDAAFKLERDELYLRMSEVDRLRRDANRADMAMCASDPDAASHALKMKSLYAQLDALESELGEKMLGLVARQQTDFMSTVWDDTIVPEVRDEWATEEAVNYSIAFVPWKFADLAMGTVGLAAVGVLAVMHLPLFAVAAAAAYPASLVGKSCERFGWTPGRVFADCDARSEAAYRACDLAPPILRVNQFVDVKAERSLQRIGTHYLARKPGADDIMVYCGYKSNYLCTISPKMLEHLKAVKSGAKLTEMNVANMAHELCLKFPNRYPFLVYQETAVHAHQIFQAGAMRRQMTCTFQSHAPLRHDARAWNPS